MIKAKFWYTEWYDRQHTENRYKTHWIFWNIMHSIPFLKSFTYLTIRFHWFPSIPIPSWTSFAVHLRADDQFHPPHQPAGENAVGGFANATWDMMCFKTPWRVYFGVFSSYDPEEGIFFELNLEWSAKAVKLHTFRRSWGWRNGLYPVQSVISSGPSRRQKQMSAVFGCMGTFRQWKDMKVWYFGCVIV